MIAAAVQILKHYLSKIFSSLSQEMEVFQAIGSGFVLGQRLSIKQRVVDYLKLGHRYSDNANAGNKAGHEATYSAVSNLFASLNLLILHFSKVID